MKKKLLGLLFSVSLASVTLFSFSGCALKSSSDMKNGQCSCEMKSDKKGSCGAGKCGSEMKKETKGSCGAGKCGSESSTEMKPKTNN